MAMKGKKVIQVGKGEVIPPLFADDILLYTENPTDAMRKLLDLINELGKITEYKTNAQKNLHSYTLTIKEQEEESRKQSHLPLQQKEQNT